MSARVSLILARRWLARHRGLLALVLLGLFVFEVGLVHIAEQFDGGAGMQAVVDMLPSFFQQLVHDKLRDFSADGVVSMGFNHPVAMTVMCSMVALFATGTAADREEGLLGALLARPVSRGAYLGGIVLCVVLLALIQPAMLLGGGMLGLSMVSLDQTVPFEVHVEAGLGLVALLLAVGGLALLAGVYAPRRGVAVTWLAAALVPAYLVEFLGFLWSGMDAVRWLSPFHYVPQLPALLGQEPSAAGLWPLLLLAALCWALAARRFAGSDE
ncbi:MAG: hypothetical protein DRQ55_03100 [Planctomycetota bacterium]|nr:MAG: hypothetical protein DRQ55_03100 [Planctomycetota bacterium]